MRDYVGIILVTISVLRTGDSDSCGTLNFDKDSYNVGECASLIYKPRNHNATRQWLKDYSVQLNSSRYHESKVGDHFILTMRNINTADSGWYTVQCGTAAYANFSHLTVSASTDNLDCGRLSFENPTVPKGESASLIYKSCNAMASVGWYKDGPEGRVIIHSKTLLESSRKYEESKTDNGLVLIIKNTDFDDAGNYFVTYGQLWSCAASLQVVEPIAPSNPEFQNVEDINNCGKCLSARLNLSMYVTCFVRGGSEPVHLNIYKSGVLQSSVHRSKTYDCQSQTNMISYSFSPANDTVFKCTVKNPALYVEKAVTIKLYIKVDPESINIKIQPTKENETSNIQCTTINGRPPTTALFYIKNNLPSNYVNITKTIQSGYTYNVTTTLWTKLTRQDNQASVRCCSDSDCSATEYLNVTFPPKSVVLSELGKVSEENGDTILQLKCDVDESNPKSVVDWKGVNNLPSRLLEEKYMDRTKTHGWNYTTSWMFSLTKEDRGRNITCQVKNSEFPHLVLQKSYRPNITFPSEKTFIQPSSEASRFSLLVTVTGGAAAIIIAIVIVVGFLTLRKKRNDAQPKRKGTQQIKDEPRHESVNPARNEPLHNEIPASNEKEMDNAPEYACVIPKANRKYGTNELKPEDTPEYSGIIPKSKRKSEKDLLKSADGTEYACVIPKAQRKQEMDQRKSDGASAKSQGDTLVYAELDLNLDSGATTRRPLTKQYEPTEYVTIDFSKTVTIKIENEEIEKEPKIEHDEMAEEGVKKENKDHHHHHLQ